MSLAGGSDSAFCNGAEPAVSSSTLDISNSAMPNVVDRLCVQRNVEFSSQKWSNGLGKVLTSGKKEGNGTNNGFEGDSNAELPLPSTILYDRKIDFSIRSNRAVGCGLVNLGNTCFLSSTLQCLCHLPPWFNYIVSDHHADNCKMNHSECFVCMFQRLLRNTLRCNGSSFSPREIVDKLKQICSHMQKGRQEDAHEFLLSLLNGMQASLLYGFQRLDPYSQETTVLCRIFGGYLRSQITCKRCRLNSNTYEHFFNISLDIKNAKSLVGALTAYTKGELMDGENAYKCDKCRRPTAAEKCYSVYKAPNVLIIQLKRYSLEEKGHSKLSHHIYFADTLDLTPFMSKPGPRLSHLYQLQCVLVHMGSSINSGHYFAYVFGLNNKWHEMNDEKVREVPFEEVKSAQAYMLFFVRKSHESSQRSYSNSSQCNSDKYGAKTAAFSGCKNKPEATNRAPFLNNILPSVSNAGYVSHNISANASGMVQTNKPLSTNTNGEKLHANGSKFSNNKMAVGNGGIKTSFVNRSIPVGSGINGIAADTAAKCSLSSSSSSLASRSSAGVTQSVGNGVKLSSSNQREKVIFKIGKPKERLNGSILNKSSAPATLSKASVTSIIESTSLTDKFPMKLVAYDDESSDQESDRNAETASDWKLTPSSSSAESVSSKSRLNGISKDSVAQNNNSAVSEAITEVGLRCLDKSALKTTRNVSSENSLRLPLKSYDLEMIEMFASRRTEPEKTLKLKRSMSDSKLHVALVTDSLLPDVSENLESRLSCGDGQMQQNSGLPEAKCEYFVKPLYNEHNEFMSVDITDHKKCDSLPVTLDIALILDCPADNNSVNNIDFSAAMPDVSSVQNSQKISQFSDESSSSHRAFSNTNGVLEEETKVNGKVKKRHRSRDSSIVRHKRHKHRHSSRDKSQSNPSSQKEVEYVWVERTLETIQQETQGDSNERQQNSSHDSFLKRRCTEIHHTLKEKERCYDRDSKHRSHLPSECSSLSPSSRNIDRDSVRFSKMQIAPTLKESICKTTL